MTQTSENTSFLRNITEEAIHISNKTLEIQI